MSRRPRPRLLVQPIRPSLEDAEGPDFSLLLTQALRADLKLRPEPATRRAAPVDGERTRPDIATLVVERLRRDPGVMGERVRFASDRHRRIRSAACRVTAVVLVIALALVAGRIEPAPRVGDPPTGGRQVEPERPGVGIPTLDTTGPEEAAPRRRRGQAGDGR